MRRPLLRQWGSRRFRLLLPRHQLPRLRQRRLLLLRLWKLLWPRLSLLLLKCLLHRKLQWWLPSRWFRLLQRRKFLQRRLCLCARL